MATREIEVEELLARRRELVLVDCREPEEHAIGVIDGSLLIPLRELPRRAGELDPGAPTVVACHHGIRSAVGAAILEALGFTDVSSLRGGLEAWAQRADPTMPRY